MLSYSIDYLKVSNGQIISYGWGFFPGLGVDKLTLCIEFSDGSIDEIDSEYSKLRDDVSLFFPDVPDAKNSGFLILAGYSKEIFSLTLRWQLSNREILSVKIDSAILEKSASNRIIPETFMVLFWKAIALLKLGRYKILINKTKHYLNGKRISRDPKYQILKNRIKGANFSILIDHDLGGGANLYRKKSVSDMVAKGEVVLLLSFDCLQLEYFLDVFDSDGVGRYSVHSPFVLLELANLGFLTNITYNCAVSFNKPMLIKNLLVELKKMTSAKLLVLAHDFFLVCPSHFLINNDGNFCNLPIKSTCESCLRKTRDGFVSFSGERDINVWRERWSGLLNEADEVRFFSKSSLDLFDKAYPLISKDRWTVVHHELLSQMNKIILSAGQFLHIGVVGSIGKHKGADIMRELALRILEKNLNIKITVFGTLDVKVPSEIVSITGPYDLQSLNNIVKNSDINLFLFPSIWPETFSYVCHELVAMGVPLAAFDFGAPSDLIKVYDKGLILKKMDADYILKELDMFWRKIYKIGE